MTKRWLNDRQPDENGDYVLVIENSRGGRISTFKGKTIEDVAEALAESAVHANEEIIRLRKPDTGRPKLKVEPRQLTPADRMRLIDDINNPERIVEAVEEIVTARQGVSPDKLGAHLSSMDQKERDQYYAAEAQAFRDTHPDFYPVPQNRDALFEELRANGWDLTRNNLSIAFETLKDRGDMIPWPNDRQPREENQPARIEADPEAQGQATPQSGPSPRPRNVSVATGLRNSDASASAPVPVKRAPKYTRADIDRMSRAEFSDKLRNEPGFRQQVDAMTA